MPKKENRISGQFVIDKTHIITDDDVCRCIIGCGMQELAQKIKNNKNGEFDHLYS